MENWQTDERRRVLRRERQIENSIKTLSDVES